MMYEIEYVNHLGERLDMNGAGIYIDASAFDDYAWGYNVLNGRVGGFYKEPVEIQAGCSIVSDTDALGVECRNRLYEITEKDVLARKPGRIYCNGWYLRCYVIESSKDLHWYRGSMAQYGLAILAEDPTWILEHAFRFSMDDAGDGLNFPFNFPCNFGNPGSRDQLIENPGFIQAPLRITVYGPAEDPKIVIGGNSYEVKANVKSGGSLVIDGADKTITLKDAYGNTENAFSGRRGIQREGSGSYVFQRLGQGWSSVNWDGSFAFEVTVFEQRGERRCVL